MQSPQCCDPLCHRNDSNDNSNRGYYKRPQLFNWITVILLVGWVGIVTVIAESTNGTRTGAMDAESFIEAKLISGRN